MATKSQNTQHTRKIGEISAQSDVPIRTIRYYEALGLIQSSTRTQGGFRLFSEDVLPRLAFIRRAQGLGFRLDEIKHILAIHDQGELPCDEVRLQIQSKVEQIDDQIHQLQLLKHQLLSLVAEVQIPEEQQHGIICPIIQPIQE